MMGMCGIERVNANATREPSKLCGATLLLLYTNFQLQNDRFFSPSTSSSFFLNISLPLHMLFLIYVLKLILFLLNLLHYIDLHLS